jgi:hypothetical protein
MDTAVSIPNTIEVRSIDFTMLESHLVSISTDVIDEDDLAEDLESGVMATESSQPIRGENNHSSTETGEGASPDKEDRSIFPYPLGSVIATVTVYLKGIENIKYKLPQSLDSLSGAGGDETNLIESTRTSKFAVLSTMLFITILYSSSLNFLTYFLVDVSELHFGAPGNRLEDCRF